MQPACFALLLFLAAVLGSLFAGKKKNRPAPPPPSRTEGAETVERWAIDPQAVAVLGDVIDVLCQVMEHPELGGPGFLLVQFPQSPNAGGRPVVSAQYPNINEALYRRIVRQELADLLEIGVPAQLLNWNPAFSTESGGIVQISVEMDSLRPDLLQQMGSRDTRTAALSTLADALGEYCPSLTVRRFGPDLLLERIRADG